MQINIGNNLFCTLLTILFIGLKLGGIISWSWWLVLMPLYLPIILGIILLLLIVIFKD